MTVMRMKHLQRVDLAGSQRCRDLDHLGFMTAMRMMHLLRAAMCVTDYLGISTPRTSARAKSANYLGKMSKKEFAGRHHFTKQKEWSSSPQISR